MANNKYKVLIVEDDLNIQNLLKMILGQMIIMF